MDRSVKVKKNVLISFATQLILVFLGFAVRKVFIATLGVSYLGYNSVFTNILQMLNLADLGIGVAITSFLYKPLADKDIERIKALMTLYKRIYNVMGFVVLASGIVVSFFIGSIIPDSKVDLWYLKVLFFINLAGTVATYFLAYKRTLIIADQQSYVTSIVDTIIYSIASIVQIGILILYPSYIIYLILNIAKPIVSNIILSLRCNRLYGVVNSNADPLLIEEYKPQIVRYVKDVFVSRIGAAVYYGTDNVIISVIKGSLLAGFLSNYTLITGYLITLITQLLASIQATFGNYINSDKNLNEQCQMTENYFCANYTIGNFCMMCFILIVQPFIKLYFGQNLVLPFSTAILLGVNLMLSIMIQLPSQVFTIYKLFRYDRPIIIVSALLNIIISVVLVKKLGIDGALIGTFVTSLIYLFSRFYIIANRVYSVPYFRFIKKIFLYFFISLISIIIALAICRPLNVDTWKGLIAHSTCAIILSLTMPTSFLSYTREFKFLVNRMVPNKIEAYFGTKHLVLLSLAIIFIIYLVEKFSLLCSIV